ncbi:MAG TPA: hypothetical protein VI386_17755 [Candidatus Sulfotelmatobacter sp.]
MRQFVLQRNEDESGVSGTGEVAEGVMFSDGRCVLRWRGRIKSLGVFDSQEDMLLIHGHGGKTVIVFGHENPALGAG